MMLAQAMSFWPKSALVIFLATVILSVVVKINIIAGIDLLGAKHSSG